MREHVESLALAAALWLSATQAGAQAHPADDPPWWAAAEVHLSVLSNLVERSTVNLSFGYSGRFGYRWATNWGVYFQAEHNVWTETELEVEMRQGVFNLGVGAERLFFDRRMRAALAAGPSILLYQTALDDPGTTGLFVDVRPTGVRWPVGKSFVLVLDPLTFTVAAPVLGGIPLVQIQYRTAFGVEYDWGR
jgi:hypothetical protein